MSLRTGSVVAWFEGKGFGFIGQNGGGPDLFVHHSAVSREGEKRLFVGESVTYEVIPDDRKAGKLMATTVLVVGDEMELDDEDDEGDDWDDCIIDNFYGPDEDDGDEYNPYEDPMMVDEDEGAPWPHQRLPEYNEDDHDDSGSQ